MNEWELNANTTVRAAEKIGVSGSDALDRVALALANVLRSYCHSAAASLDGQMVYGRPAQFDPESEQVDPFWEPVSVSSAMMGQVVGSGRKGSAARD